MLCRSSKNMNSYASYVCRSDRLSPKSPDVYVHLLETGFEDKF